MADSAQQQNNLLNESNKKQKFGNLAMLLGKTREKCERFAYWRRGRRERIARLVRTGADRLLEKEPAGFSPSTSRLPAVIHEPDPDTARDSLDLYNAVNFANVRYVMHMFCLSLVYSSLLKNV